MLKLKSQTIDNLYNEISKNTSTSNNALITTPIQPENLTPRSESVLLKLGIDPDVLRIRDINSFWEPGIAKQVQKLRFETNEGRRIEMYQICRSERNKIINNEFNNQSKLMNLTNLSNITTEVIKPELSSTLIQNEKIRLEKLKIRQEKELQNMINYELDKAILQEQKAKEIEEKKKKELLLKKRREKRLKLMAEERHLQELAKYAFIEKEEEERKLAEIKELEFSRKKQQEILLKEQELVNYRQKINNEKIRKIEERKKKVADHVLQENIRLRAELDAANKKNREKHELFKEKRKKVAEVMRLRRLEEEKRIEKNLLNAEKNEDEKKLNFKVKLDKAEEIKLKQQHDWEHLQKLKSKEEQLNEEKRLLTLHKQKEEQERNEENILKALEQDEIRIKQLNEKQNYDFQLKLEMNNIKKRMKLENVARIKRANEYKKLSTIKKIQETDSRVNEVTTQQKELYEKRRKAAQCVTLQKETIGKVMDMVRTNTAIAKKLMNTTLNNNGKISINDLLDKTILGHRPKSVPVNRRKESQSKQLSAPNLFDLSDPFKDINNEFLSKSLNDFDNNIMFESAEFAANSSNNSISDYYTLI